MSSKALEINAGNAHQLRAALAPESPLHSVLDKIDSNLSAGKRVFLLEWEGRDLPAGVSVDGRTIGGADVARVFDESGDVIGTFDRLVVDGGQTGHFQQVVVFVQGGAK